MNKVDKQEKRQRIIKLCVGIGVPIAAIATSSLVAVGSYLSYKRYHSSNAKNENIDNSFVSAVNYSWPSDSWTEKTITPAHLEINQLATLTKSKENAGLNIFIWKSNSDNSSFSNNQYDYVEDLLDLAFSADTPVKIFVEKEKSKNKIKDVGAWRYTNLLKNRVLSDETIQKENYLLSSFNFMQETYFDGIRKIVTDVAKIIRENTDRKINIWVPAYMLSEDNALIELYGFPNVKILGIGRNQTELTDQKNSFIDVLRKVKFTDVNSLSSLTKYLMNDKGNSYISLSTLYPNIYYFFNNKANVQTYNNEVPAINRFYAYSNAEAPFNTKILLDDVSIFTNKSINESQKLKENQTWYSLRTLLNLKES
ncbi:hypothetical protein [Mycoplasmopsis felifaucium]|uniref:Uncharacterized protein n=1 Tax=Mycoplasmopsis felifaucium TaxID=35768 RepID=A0ABZ2RRF4_9BACT